MRKYGNQFRGLEAYYEVSSYGRIKSLARTIEKSNFKHTKYQVYRPERMLKPAADACGYLHVIIGLPKQKAELWKMHQLVWYAFHPEYDRKKCRKASHNPP